MIGGLVRSTAKQPTIQRSVHVRRSRIGVGGGGGGGGGGGP